MMKLRSIALATLALASTTAFAVPAGTWTVGVGAAHIDPKSGASSLANDTLAATVDSATNATLAFEYFPVNNVGVELLAALPFEHDITVADKKGNELTGKTTHLPPTLSVNYHFDGLHSKVKPFVGVGVNYTTFWNERLYTGGNNEFKLDDSVGVAGNVGVDFKLSNSESLRLNARYIDIKTDATLDGAELGEVDVSPWVYGVSFVKAF